MGATLYLDRKDLDVRHEGKQLCLYEAGARRGTIPLHLLERVVMRGQATISTGAMCLLAESGVSLLVIGGRHGKATAMLNGHWHGDARRRIAQYQWHHDPDNRVSWSRRLVQLKLRSQLNMLQLLQSKRTDKRGAIGGGLQQIRTALNDLLAAPDNTLSIPRLMGIEGAAAAAYFSSFIHVFPPSLNFTGRNRRPPKDPVNAVLSFAYTLLHADAVRACHQNGLDPYVGFFHEPAYWRESLAADLIEPLRVKVDAWVWRMFADRELRAEDFFEDKGGIFLKKEPRSRFYAAYEQFAPPVRRLLRRYGLKVARELLQVHS